MKLLTDKVYATSTNNWYAPSSEFQALYPSIQGAIFMDQTSSAGDWSGFIVQKTGTKSAVAIGFFQENNYPYAGFTLYTATYPFYKGDFTDPKFVENAKNRWMQMQQFAH
jgi:hypothetical protein